SYCRISSTNGKITFSIQVIDNLMNQVKLNILRIIFFKLFYSACILQDDGREIKCGKGKFPFCPHKFNPIGSSIFRSYKTPTSTSQDSGLESECCSNSIFHLV